MPSVLVKSIFFKFLAGHWLNISKADLKSILFNLDNDNIKYIMTSKFEYLRN